MKKAILLAAGKGSRLSPYTQLIPKPLMPIIKDQWFGRGILTIIEYIFLQLKKANITEITIILNYQGETIKKYLGNGETYDIQINYIWQKELLGNGDAFYLAKENSFEGNEKEVIVLDCDNFVDNEYFLESLSKFHQKNNSDVTVAVCKVKNPSKFAIFKINDTFEPLDIIEKPEDNSLGNLAKSGIMILSEKALSYNRKIALVENQQEYTTTQMISFFLKQTSIDLNLYSIPNGFNDIGTWDEYLPILKKKIY